jgi:hypothetical protein
MLLQSLQLKNSGKKKTSWVVSLQKALQWLEYISVKSSGELEGLLEAVKSL